MKVSDLIAKLSKCDPDATVLLMGEYLSDDSPSIKEYDNASDLALRMFNNPRAIVKFAEKYGHDKSGKMVVIWTDNSN